MKLVPEVCLHFIGLLRGYLENVTLDRCSFLHKENITKSWDVEINMTSFRYEILRNQISQPYEAVYL